MRERAIAYDLKLPEQVLHRIEELLKDNDRTYIKYPWEGLEQILDRQKKDTFKFIGYGSLLNGKSAAITVSVKKVIPILSFGIYRIFNYVIPKNNIRYGMTNDPIKRAALNVSFSGDKNDFINGILIEIPLKDLNSLRLREVAYDLVQVPCILWEERNAQPFTAYALYCPYKDFNGIEKTNDGLEPHSEYYNVCREGALSFGEEFLECWKATTFLADGISSMNIWEKGKGNP